MTLFDRWWMASFGPFEELGFSKELIAKRAFEFGAKAGRSDQSTEEALRVCALENEALLANRRERLLEEALRIYREAGEK